jgi:hypothetical protein
MGSITQPDSHAAAIPSEASLRHVPVLGADISSVPSDPLVDPRPLP